MKYHIVLILLCLLSSCATIFNKPVVSFKVSSDTDSVQICVNHDTTKWYYTPTWVAVTRSKNDLWITAKKDTTHKKIRVKSRHSHMFWLNLVSSAGLVL